ncbi:MAG TPA: hypothetical protein GX505_03760 [Clostridiales bacterium]|nr:hypothetical protein [Clostridiales bacterium]
MSYRQFHRSFIILKVKDSGYELHEGKEPAGYCKLEIKNNHGKMQLYIQDMKPAVPQQAIYDVVLLSSKDGIKPVKLTSIQVPDSGRGEYEITFDPDNVQETGNSIGQYHALAVVDRRLDGSGLIRYPLVGYSDKRVELDWTNKATSQLRQMYQASRGLSFTRSPGILSYSDQTGQDAAVPGKTALSSAAEPGVPEERKEAAINQFEAFDYNKQTNAEDSNYNTISEEESINPELLNFVPPDISYIYKNTGQQPADEILHKEEIKYAEEHKQGETAEHDHEESFYSMQLGSTPYWSKVEAYYNQLFDNHKKVCPFDDAVGEVDWIRVENRNEPVYPQYSIYDPYRTEYAGLDHYLVGLVRNKGRVQYVVYGIPGVYSAVPPMSMHGFSRWLPVKNGYGAGYWLLYIDAITGNIAYPY